MSNVMLTLATTHLYLTWKLHSGTCKHEVECLLQYYDLQGCNLCTSTIVFEKRHVQLDKIMDILSIIK